MKLRGMDNVLRYIKEEMLGEGGEGWQVQVKGFEEKRRWGKWEWIEGRWRNRGEENEQTEE